MKAIYNIYAEMTPNPNAMKFVSDRKLTEITVEFPDQSKAAGHPLPEKLFRFPFVKSILITPYYVSVIKNDSVEWDDIVLELREFISQHLNRGGLTIDDRLVYLQKTTGDPLVSIQSKIPENETEEKIVNILNEYVKPAIESDGGAIEFRGFQQGKVYVALKGSCSGCPSSMYTLKNGIEQLLKNMIPEVEEVVAENISAFESNID